MSYTLRGRLESRLAVLLVPLLAACVLAPILHRWWPLELAGLMAGVGLALDATLYHRLLPYQPGWVALPLGLAELAAVMALARASGIGAPLASALGFYAGSWLTAQAVGHAALPLLHLPYAEHGGELGRGGPALAVAVVALFAAAAGVASGSHRPAYHLAAGIHRGPLVVDHPEILVGDRGTVVRGGIRVLADDVTLRGITVDGGTYGIEVDRARNVVLDRMTVRRARLDAIHVRQSHVTISRCRIEEPASGWVQGIDISFSMDQKPSVVDGCTIRGGREGIVTHSSTVMVHGNRISGTTLRGMSLTEMSMDMAEGNHVHDVLGVGILCGDHSMCELERNVVTGVKPDQASGDLTRGGYGVLVQFGAEASLRDNRLSGGVGAFDQARVSTH